jgi:CelD/BcsL family acetyltransferase involved in cellulose biosynthesis
VLAGIVHDVARDAGAVAIHLANMPASWRGMANPLASLARHPSANDCFVLPLEPDWAAQHARTFSSKARGVLRRRRRRLEESGGVRIARAETVAERLEWLEAFFRQKREQLSQAGAGNAFDDPAIQAVYRSLAGRGEDGLDVDALVVGEAVAAVVLSMRHGDCEHMLNTSITTGALKEGSPGKLLVHAHVEAAHRSGAALYDLGPGHASYKEEWRSQTMPLVSWLTPTRAAGWPVVAAIGAAGWSKRRIKASPRLWALASDIRRHLAALR